MRWLTKLKWGLIGVKSEECPWCHHGRSDYRPHRMRCERRVGRLVDPRGEVVPGPLIVSAGDGYALRAQDCACPARPMRDRWYR